MQVIIKLMKVRSQDFDWQLARGKQYTQQPITTSAPQDVCTCKPISYHYKQFLLERASSYRKTEQSSPADKPTKIAFTHSVKKNSLCRKILNTSINKYTLQQDLTRYRQQFEAGKNQTRDMHSFVFREIWENQQKQKFEQNITRKGKSQFMIFEANHQRGKSEEAKTFEDFIENKKKHDRNRSWQQTEQNSLESEALERKEQITLTIAGNHQQLKKKPQTAKKTDKNKAAKLRFVKNNKTAAVVQLADPNPEYVQPVAQKAEEIKQQSRKQHQKKDKEPVEIKKDLGTKEAQAFKLKKKSEAKSLQGQSSIQMQYQNCYKNFFSPFNGIQIKYLSSENQDSFVTINKFPIKRSIQPFRSIRPTFRPILKKHQAPTIDSRSIVFRSKSNTKQFQPISIDPWKVHQEQLQQFNDFYQQH